MDSEIEHIEIKKLVKPLRLIFRTASGEKKNMESLIVRVVLKNKKEGIGECPTSRAFPFETLQVIEDFVKRIIPSFIGKDILEYQTLIEKIKKNYPIFRLSLSGLELALFRAHLSYLSISEFSFWGAKKRKIETDITIPSVRLDKALRWLSEFERKGFRFFKIKLKGELEKDIRFLSRIMDYLKRTLAYEYKLRLDMNESYCARDFLILADYLKKNEVPVECIEQPLPREDYKGLKEIADRVDLPIVLDESIKEAEDLNRIGALGLRFAPNIKLAKSGVSESKRIYEIAKKEGLRTMVGCMTETNIGLSGGIFFAMGHGDFDFIDLDGVYFIRQKPSFSSIEIQGPFYILSAS